MSDFSKKMNESPLIVKEKQILVRKQAKRLLVRAAEVR
ncbi:hypothetical protein SSIN_1108 [Streptococcus sinensis]|uniref:Uncharacterized protein n=1 Tax=Streptococcus sinensis TaxID=176090 RepID=A0A0A0DEF8_9STRE|nr:hypothetical protein SSIN_1108 [Streptococcus sinensis]